MIEEKTAIEMAKSRDCKCVSGEDRDNNYKETIQLVYSSFKEDLKLFSETHRELMNEKDREIRKLKEIIANSNN